MIPVLATLSRAQPSTPPGTKFPKIAICAVESGDSRGGSGSAVHFTMSDSPLTREIRRLVAEGKIENGGTLLRTLGFLADGEHETASTSLLVSNHMEAFAARKAHSWAKEVPHEIFLTDVLPHACLDETRENWRPGFRRRFAPMVAGT